MSSLFENVALRSPNPGVNTNADAVTLNVCFVGGIIPWLIASTRGVSVL